MTAWLRARVALDLVPLAPFRLTRDLSLSSAAAMDARPPRSVKRDAGHIKNC